MPKTEDGMWIIDDSARAYSITQRKLSKQRISKREVKIGQVCPLNFTRKI